MALKNIPLPAIVLANLYKNSLVELKDNGQEAVQQSTDSMPGGDNKHVLLLVHNEDAELLPYEELTFLSGILTACKLSMNDIAIANLHKEEASRKKDLPYFFKSEIIILFGIELSTLELPFKIPKFQVQLYKDKKYVCVPSLSALQADAVLKRKLWELLRVLFLA